MLLAAVAAWIEPSGRAAPPTAAFQAADDHRAATVRPGGALLFRQPERAGMPLAALPSGQHLQVHRLVWKSLVQWAEVEAPGGWIGYVLTTEIDLS